MKKVYVSLLSICLIWSLWGCSMENPGDQRSKNKSVELTVSAAISLNDALKDVKTSFEKKYHNISISYNLGGSGALKQQILQGAPSDIFISAANEPFKNLIQKGLIDKHKQTNLLKNKLVLVINNTNSIPIKDFRDLSKESIKKIAIGTPEFVPAGMYAKQTLQHLMLWGAIQSKLVQTKDVRQVLTYVETNNVDAGIVYMTDAKISDKVKVVQIADENDHEPIIYPAGLLKSSLHQKEATLFYNYLKSKTARMIFEKYGFTVLE